MPAWLKDKSLYINVLILAGQIVQYFLNNPLLPAKYIPWELFAQAMINLILERIQNYKLRKANGRDR